MKEIRGKLKETRGKLKETRGNLKEAREKLKETSGKPETIFWKVVFSTKLPSHEASVSWLKSLLTKGKKQSHKGGSPQGPQNPANPSQ